MKEEKDEVIQDERDEKIKMLEQQMETLMAMFKNMNNAVAPSLNNERIKIVHLVDRAEGLSTFIQLSNLEISLRFFGEERNLSIPQFEELVGKYRSWFTSGIIAVHSDYEDLAQHYGLETNKGYPMSSDFFKTIQTKSMADIEDIYPRLPEAGKDSLIGYWVREARKGTPYFADIRSLEVLNRLSDGAVTQVIAELNAKRGNK